MDRNMIVINLSDGDPCITYAEDNMVITFEGEPAVMQISGEAA